MNSERTPVPAASPCRHGGGFSAVRALFSDLPAFHESCRAQAASRNAELVKPRASLGRLEELALWLSAWQGRNPPRAERILVNVYAGSHGVAHARAVSAYPPSVTHQMVAAFKAGHGAINQLCALHDFELRIHELALSQPTGDITSENAMSEAECVKAFMYGVTSVPSSGCDMVCLGEMGIGNTTSAAALCHALYGGEARSWTGVGTGVAGAALRGKIEAVACAVARVGGEADGLALLASLGGREIAALCGAILGARLGRVPVLLDGYVCCAAAAVVARLAADGLSHCRAAHLSTEPGHRLLLRELDMRPLLELDMALGEASAAALAAGLAKAAVLCHKGMATFGEAAVSDRS